jgi:Fe-S oxidoreductase
MSIEDLHVYQESCTRCSQCKFLPMPDSADFATICPSIDYGQFHAFSGSGKLITAYALSQGKAAVNDRLVESVYACTMCGACDTACKTNLGDLVEPLDTLYELRAKLASDGHVPSAIAEAMRRMRQEGSRFGPRSERSVWAEGLGLPDATRRRVEVLLHVGDSNAHDRGAWRQLHTVVQLLRQAGVDFGIAYDAESDAGGYAHDTGFRADALRLAQEQAERVRRSGATVLLTACADAYAAFRNVYPRLGVSLEGVHVMHTTDFLVQLVESGQLALAGACDTTVTYHDPCRLGRLSEPYKPWKGQWVTVMNTLSVPGSRRPVRFGNDGNYEAPRRLLRRIEGVRLVEMERNRLFAYCCGAGAGAKEAYPEMAQAAAVQRLREAESTGASKLVTACTGCQRHLSEIAASNGIRIEVQGLFDLLASSLESAFAETRKGQ